MKTKTKSIIKKISLSILSLFVILLITIFAALQWPGIWLTPKTLNWAQAQINKHFPDYHLDWTNPQVKTETLGLFSDRLLVSFDRFCASEKDQAQACFDSVQAGLAYSLPKLKLLEVGPVQALNGDVSYRQVATTEEKKSSSKMPTLPKFLADAILKPVRVEVAKYKIEMSSRNLQGDIKVHSETKPETSGNSYTLISDLQDQSLGWVQASAISHSEKVKGPWSFESQADLHLPNKSRLQAQASLEPHDKGFSYAASTRYQSSGPQAHVSLTGHHEENRWIADVNGEVKAGPRVEFQNCQLQMTQETKEQAKVETDCPVMLALNQFTQKNVKVITRGLKNPGIGAHIYSNINMPFPPDLSKDIAGTVRVLPISNFQTILKTDGQAVSNFRFEPSKFPQFKNLKVTVDLGVQAPQFQKLVALLKDTPMAVPAPLHTLQGPISVKAKGDLDQSGGRIDSQLLAQLKSPYQSLQARGNSQLFVDLKNLKPQQIALQSDLALDDIKLTLPPIDKAPPTQILPDKRIQRTNIAQLPSPFEKKAKSSIPFKYAIHIHTPDASPLELASSSTDEPVKMALDLTLRDNQRIIGVLDLAPVKYDVAGIKGTTGGLILALRTSDYQTFASGSVTGEKNKKEEGAIIAPEPMDSFVRPQPKLPIPLVEIATAMGLQDPLSLAVVDQRQPNPSQTQANFGQIPLQIRRRY